MFYKAAEHKVIIKDTAMDYVEFGYGSRPLIILPGLGDGLRTVHGQAVNLAFYYRKIAPYYRVYIFSRKNKLEEGCTTKDMAEDLWLALEQLRPWNTEKIYLMGISQGGMIAQHFAIAHPDIVEKLVLGVTASKQNEILKNAVTGWMEMAAKGDYRSLMTDTSEKTYSLKTLKKYRPLYPLLCRVGKPEDFSRFLIQAESCLTHNAYEELSGISCPVLILGGGDDKIVGTDAAPEMAEKIKQCKMKIYEGLGHGAYDETEDFNRQVMDFLNEIALEENV